MWEAIILAAGAVVGGLVNALSAHSNTKMAASYQQKMQEQQQQYSSDMWNKNNAYNTPANQVSRLNEAGINPALALSGGLQNVSQQASTPSVPSFNSQPSSLGIDFGQTVSQMVSKGVENKKTAAEVSNIRADTESKALDNYVKLATAEDKIEGSKNQYRSFKWMEKQAYEDYLASQRNNDIGDATMQYAMTQEQVRTDTMLLEKALKNADLNSYQERLGASLADTWADVSLKYAQGKATLQQAKAALVNAYANSEVAHASARKIGAEANYQEGVNNAIRHSKHGFYGETTEGKTSFQDWLNSNEGERQLKIALLSGGEQGFIDFLKHTADLSYDYQMNRLDKEHEEKFGNQKTTYTYDSRGKVRSKTTSYSNSGSRSNRSSGFRFRRRH